MIFEPAMASRPRIIIATTGTGGDIRPFVAIAQALSRRGHNVVLLAPGFHEPLLRSRGIEYKVFGTVEQFQSVLDDPKLWDERKGFGVVWKGLEPHLDVIRKMVTRQSANARCLLLCHPILVPLADIAKAVRPDLRIACAYLAPSNLCSSHDFLTAGSQRIPPWLPLDWRRLLWRWIHKIWIDPAVLPGLNAFRKASGLAPVSGFFEHMHRVPDASVSLFPDWFASAQPDWPAPFIRGEFPITGSGATAALPPQLEMFLARGEAPIAFTPGTGHRHAAQYFAIALAALKRLGRRGLFVTPCAAQVPPDLPPEIMWIEQASFDVLLPRLAALVHHGGIGTMAEAFRAGIPQLIAPYAFDQFDNGLRAQKLGVAEVIPARRLSARRLHHRLLRLLSSEDIARSCAAISVRAAAGAAHPSLVRRIEECLGIAAAADECAWPMQVLPAP